MSLGLAPARIITRLESDRTSDPLSQFQFNSEVQREFCRRLYEGVESYVRSGNEFGKTMAGAAALLAMARGDRRLGVAPIDPQWGHLAPLDVPAVTQPSVWFILTASQKGQLEGVQPAYLNLLGDWPHHRTYSQAGDGMISTLYVRYRGCRSDDFHHWSRFRFHCQGSAQQSLPGGRIDGAHADEPPDMEHWREVRARARANRKLYLGITATPLDKREWEPLRADFAGCLNAPHLGRIELRAAVSDNRFLDREHLAELCQRWSHDETLTRAVEERGSISDAEIESFKRRGVGDQRFPARWRGDYVDMTGQCPFDQAALARWEKRCTPGRPIGVAISTELDSTEGRIVVPLTVAYTEWEPYREEEEYFIVADPSLGIDDPEHDPGAVWVVSRRRPALVAEYCGPLAGYGLGFLAGVLSLRYGNGQVDCDMTGGYGQTFLHGARSAGASNFVLETYEDRLGMVSQRIGFRVTAENRATHIGAVQEVLRADSILVQSAGTVSELQGIVVDRTGKIQATGRRHDERMILLGRAAILLRTHPVAPYIERDDTPSFEEALRQMGGRVDTNGHRRKVRPSWR